MRNNYIDILQNRVEIPIIQRDYAQGRTDTKTNKIRKDFLDAIFDFIFQKANNQQHELELDFIYGLNKGVDRFIPIDGQQRLTTLWLFYWYVSAKENVEGDERMFLKNFVYETRHSTTQFCKSLVTLQPQFSHTQISNEIKDQPWYFETWNYDPGIKAMLVVLDDIENRYSGLNSSNVWKLIGNDRCPFFFYKLDMEKVGLTDDLYIKMNSRGKALTEFEYFKAGFTELISDTTRRDKFEISIDGKWIDMIWHIVYDSCDEEDDIAMLVDDAFLNLFNFICSVLSFKNNIKTEDGEYYQDTETTPKLLKEIYADINNLDFLFDVMDNVCLHQESNPGFWKETFYYTKTDFEANKTRLYFQHGETNLLKRCLFHFDQVRGLSFPEQLLLLACFTHFEVNDPDFEKHIRTIRNLVVNSENELRETILGRGFQEVGQFITTGNYDVFSVFKTDQIEEEKLKAQYLNSNASDETILRRLEDSDIFRGSITLLPLNEAFNTRASHFLKLFDEDEMISAFREKCNLLLCFGDYSQDEGSLTNMLARNKRDIRAFFTTPGYNKGQLYSKTQSVLTTCIDFFLTNPSVTAQEKIKETIEEFSSNPKDWRYYFLKYSSFRHGCHYGYYYWRSNEYLIWKMGKRQFNGFHWDPFLHEVSLKDTSGKIILGEYGMYDKLVVSKGRSKVEVSSLASGQGFLFINGNTTVDVNPVLESLQENDLINEDHELIIEQNVDGLDLEDRIVKLKSVLTQILS